MSKLSSRKSNASSAPLLITGGRDARPSVPARARAIKGFETPRLFLFSLVILIGGLIFWAAIAPVDRVVRVEGTIIPAGRSQQIQHLEGGIIATIDTVEGASVKRGDLLLTIDDTTAGSNLSETQSKLNSIRARVVRLDAETQGKDKLVFPSDLAASPVVAAEQSLFIAQRQKLDEEISVHQDTIKQHEADITQAQQQETRLTTELATAHQRSDMMQGMAAHGAASKIEVLEAQSREERLKTEIGENQDSIPKLKAATAEEQARIQTAKADFSSQAHNDLVAALEESDRLKQTMAAAADRMKRTEIRAPIDGVINHIFVNTVGGVVKPGETLIELTPRTDEVLIEAKAMPRDRGYLRVGLDSQIRISAYDTGELGPLKGTVTEVGADSLQDPHGDSYYQINVLVRTIPPSYADHVIVPGMTATVDIVTGRRTVLAYLLSPLRKFTYNMFKDPR